jgi:uncharacterized protein (UPF0332 family)
LKQFDLLFVKAERFIRSAQLLAENGDLDSAASRLYYAMFFVAEALLDAKGLTFSSHRAVISAYGQHFARTKVLDPRFHQALLSAFSQRQIADYAFDADLQPEDITRLTVDAVDFLNAGRVWLERSRGESS